MKIRCNKKYKQYKKGFILIMVLLVLALAGILLAAGGRHSGQKALRAANALEELQLKWGMITCQTMIMPQTETILTAEQKNTKTLVITAARSVTLGGMKFSLVVSDEQAKANVNMMASRLTESLEARVAALQSRMGNSAHINLRPAQPPAGVIARYPRLYTAYEQIFEFSHPLAIMDAEHPEYSCTGRLTCWGSGMVNIRRADMDVLREATAGILDESQLFKLCQYVEQNPKCRLEDVIRNLKLSEKQAAQVRYALTDTSGCQSLWVIATGKTRTWYRLCVYSSGDAGTDRQRLLFTW